MADITSGLCCIYVWYNGCIYMYATAYDDDVKKRGGREGKKEVISWLKIKKKIVIKKNTGA